MKCLGMSAKLLYASSTLISSTKNWVSGRIRAFYFGFVTCWELAYSIILSTSS